MKHIFLWAIPVFTLCMLIELWVSRHPHLQGYTFKDTVASLSMGVGNLLLKYGTRAGFVWLYFAIYEFRLFELPADAWWVWLLLFVAEDFCYYWYHRCAHEVRILWAAHVNHHSSTHYNLSTALRQSWSAFLLGWIFGCGTGPKRLELVVGFIWVDSRCLAGILDPFRIILRNFGPDRLPETLTL